MEAIIFLIMQQIISWRSVTFCLGRGEAEVSSVHKSIDSMNFETGFMLL